MHSRLAEIFEETSGIEALRRVVNLIRPPSGSEPKQIDARINGLADALGEDPTLLGAFDDALVEVLTGSRLSYAFAESGVLEMRGFLSEFASRLVRRFLPRQHGEDAARQRILQIFSPGDWRWLTQGSTEPWSRLFRLVAGYDHWEPPRAEIAEAMQMLAQRVGALGAEDRFQGRLAVLPDGDFGRSCFLDLTAHTHAFLDSGSGSEHPSDHAFDRLQETIDECYRAVIALRINKSTVGTNLDLTRATRRMLQQLDRLQLLAQLLHPNRGRDPATCAARLLYDLVEAEQTATSVRRLFSQSTDLVAHQIAEHGAKKGQKYITDTSKGYWKFLRAALRGGAIVAPFAVIKLLLVQLPLSLGAQALLYSINYATCFTLLYVTGSILATKQPAVTASAIAQKIDEATTGDEAVEGVADVVVLVWRSQFISFVGNLLAALPLGFAIAWGASELFGNPLADASKAEYLVDGVHPFASGALGYAAIAGVGLFLAGLVGGAVDNHLSFGDIKRRITRNPGLAFLGDRRADIAGFVDKHFGSITGNVVLGFLLGCAGPLGVILGLPFDIRHIAFSSANVGIAAQTLPELMTSSVGLIALLGVVGIGFFNFLISFLLTMGVGLDARDLTLVDIKHLFPLLARRAVERPLEWFWPTETPHYDLPDRLS